MDKVELLAKLRREWTSWNALLTQVEPSRMTEPGVVGPWSIKDLIAHVTWYENQMVNLDGDQQPPDAAYWELALDERNLRIYTANQHRSLADIQREAENVHHQVLETIERLSEDQLQNAVHFPWMPPDWIPWKLIASNTYEHYHQHIGDVEAWIQKAL